MSKSVFTASALGSEMHIHNCCRVELSSIPFVRYGKSVVKIGVMFLLLIQ